MATNPLVFISYVHDDLALVERLVSDLRARGADVWFDRDVLLPGMMWRDEIRIAISTCQYFVACFSISQNSRHRAYMNEELELAIEEIRRRGTAMWFVPVVLSGRVPDLRIGAMRTLRDIQYVRLSKSDWPEGIEAIARALGLSHETGRDGRFDSRRPALKTPQEGFIRRWFLAPIAAAIVMLVALAGTWNDATPLATQHADLIPVYARGASQPALILRDHGSHSLALIVPSSSSREEYRLDVTPVALASQRPIISLAGLRPGDDGAIHVPLSNSTFLAGRYQLALYRATPEETVATYSVLLR